jgi:hypothetical protein
MYTLCFDWQLRDRVSVGNFVANCTTNPVLCSWLAHYDDPDDCSDSPPAATNSNSSSTSAATATAVEAPVAVSSLEELQPLVQRCSKQEAANAGLFPPAPPTISSTAPAAAAAVDNIRGTTTTTAAAAGDATAAATEDNRPQWLRAADALAAASALPAAAATDEDEEGGDAPAAVKVPVVTAPDAQLKLQWVYGIGSAGSSAGGAAYSAKGSIVYT